MKGFYITVLLLLIFTTTAVAQKVLSSPHTRPGIISGTLWFGAKAGVARYDGNTSRQNRDSKQFVHFTEKDGLVSDYVEALYRDADGFLWIGTTDGVSRYDGTTFTNFTMNDGLAGDWITSIYQTPDRVMWFGTDGGVSRYEMPGLGYDGERFTNLTPEDGLAHDLVWSIYGAPDGMMWFGTMGGGVSVYDGKRFIRNFTRKDGLAGTRVRGFTVTTMG